MSSSRSKSSTRRSSCKSCSPKESPCPPNKSRNLKLLPCPPVPKKLTPNPKMGSTGREAQQKKNRSVSGSGSWRDNEESCSEKKSHAPSAKRNNSSSRKSSSSDQSRRREKTILPPSTPTVSTPSKLSKSSSSSGGQRSASTPSSSRKKSMKKAKSHVCPESIRPNVSEGLYAYGPPDWGVQISRHGDVHFGVAEGTSACVSITSGEVSIVGTQSAKCKSFSHGY